MLNLKETLASFYDLKALNPSDLDYLVNQSQIKEFPLNQTIITQGQEYSFIYFILSGSLSQSIDSIELTPIKPGDMIGTLSLIENRSSLTTIKTNEHTQVLSISQAILVRKLQLDQDFAARFYEMVSLQLSQDLRSLSNILVKHQIKPRPPLRKVLLVFGVLNEQDIDWIINQGQIISIENETILIQQNQPVSDIYLVLEGILSVIIALNINQKITEKEVSTSLKGEILGEMSYLEKDTASATIKAKQKSILLAISQLKIAEQIKQNRPFASRFYHSIALILSDRISSNLLNLARIESELEEDELDLDLLEIMSLAGTRFQWMIERLNN